MYGDRHPSAKQSTAEAHCLSKGMLPAAARETAQTLGQAVDRLGACGREAAYAFWVPGRIEVLGKHTDYAGGRSLLAAVEAGFCFAAARSDAHVRVMPAGAQEQLEFPLIPDLHTTPGHWSNYVMAAARRLARNFPGPAAGADIAFASTLPPAAGMSSSSALVVGTYLCLAALNRLEERPEYRESIRRPEQLAEYLGTLENGQSYGALAGDCGVGTFGGSEDHTAILFCRPRRLSQYAYAPTRFEQSVPLPAGYLFVVADSGIAAEKTGAARALYNRAAQAAAAVAQSWRDATGYGDAHMAALLARTGGDRAPIEQVLRCAESGTFSPEELVARLAHFHAENEEIIPAAGAALAVGDLTAFGRAVARSQDLAERLLGNQTPQTVYLAGSARRLGAVAASAFGAGFGGSVWALVAEDEAPSFMAAWHREYAVAFPIPAARARFLASQPGPGVFGFPVGV